MLGGSAQLVYVGGRGARGAGAALPGGQMTDEDRQIMLAVERFAATVWAPILFEIGPDLVDQIGTGILFDHEGRLLLVTAHHLFDDLSPRNW